MNDVRLVQAALESVAAQAKTFGKTLLFVMQMRAAAGYDSAASFVSSNTSGGRRTDFSIGTGSSGLSRSDAASISVYLIELHARALVQLNLTIAQATPQQNQTIKDVIASYLRPVTGAVNDWSRMQK